MGTPFKVSRYDARSCTMFGIEDRCWNIYIGLGSVSILRKGNHGSSVILIHVAIAEYVSFFSRLFHSHE